MVRADHAKDGKGDSGLLHNIRKSCGAVASRGRIECAAPGEFREQQAFNASGGGLEAGQKAVCRSYPAIASVLPRRIERVRSALAMGGTEFSPCGWNGPRTISLGENDL